MDFMDPRTRPFFEVKSTLVSNQRVRAHKSKKLQIYNVNIDWRTNTIHTNRAMKRVKEKDGSRATAENIHTL